MLGTTLESDGKHRSAFALIASVIAHAALVVSVRSAVEIESSSVPVTDFWSARSIEVGTLPEAMRLASPSVESTAPNEPEPNAGTTAPSPGEAQLPPTNPERASEIAHEASDALDARPVRAERNPTRGRERDARDEAAASPSARAEATASSTPHTEHGAAPATPKAPGAPSPDAGEQGALGLPPGVRHFAAAFTRALPAGIHADGAWSVLPLGRVGSATLEVRIDSDGRIADVSTEAPAGAPPILTRMLNRALMLLRAGTFSLDPRRVTPGTERLEIEVTLSDRAPNPDPTADARHLQAVGFAAPTRERAGHARFTLNSGRHMEAVVRIVPTSAP